MPAPDGPEPPRHEPVDPDTAGERLTPAPLPLELTTILGSSWDVLLSIAVGGVLGSLARWGIEDLLPHRPGGVPWGTFGVNVVGAFLLGLLMHFVVRVWAPSRYLRPFLGVGVLGGFTTFSTFAVEIRGLVADGYGVVAFGYTFGSLVLGIPAVFLGSVLGRSLVRGQRR